MENIHQRECVFHCLTLVLELMFPILNTGNKSETYSENQIKQFTKKTNLISILLLILTYNF